jgi:hypothetical protein
MLKEEIHPHHRILNLPLVRIASMGNLDWTCAYVLHSFHSACYEEFLVLSLEVIFSMGNQYL